MMLQSRSVLPSGFTLLETVIVCALSAAMLVTLSALIYQFNGAVAYEQTGAQSSDSASAALREIEVLVLQADAVPATHVFSGATYTSSASVLVLEIPAIDGSGNAIANTYDYAVFYRSGTQLYRLLQTNAASTRTPGSKLLSSTVIALSFSYNDADFSKVHTVTVDLQIQARVKQNVLSDHRNEEIRLRNF